MLPAISEFFLIPAILGLWVLSAYGLILMVYGNVMGGLVMLLVGSWVFFCCPAVLVWLDHCAAIFLRKNRRALSLLYANLTWRQRVTLWCFGSFVINTRQGKFRNFYTAEGLWYYVSPWAVFSLGYYAGTSSRIGIGAAARSGTGPIFRGASRETALSA